MSDTIAALAMIFTYEGTETIQTLLVGRDITGVSASQDQDGIRPWSRQRR
jgi:hypothetical protein